MCPVFPGCSLVYSSWSSYSRYGYDPHWQHTNLTSEKHSAAARTTNTREQLPFYLFLLTAQQVWLLCTWTVSQHTWTESVHPRQVHSTSDQQRCHQWPQVPRRDSEPLYTASPLELGASATQNKKISHCKNHLKQEVVVRGCYNYSSTQLCLGQHFSQHAKLSNRLMQWEWGRIIFSYK